MNSKRNQRNTKKNVYNNVVFIIEKEKSNKEERKKRMFSVVCVCVCVWGCARYVLYHIKGVSSYHHPTVCVVQYVQFVD